MLGEEVSEDDMVQTFTLTWSQKAEAADRLNHFCTFGNNANREPE
jgi:hypothetical protein